MHWRMHNIPYYVIIIFGIVCLFSPTSSSSSSSSSSLTSTRITSTSKSKIITTIITILSLSSSIRLIPTIRAWQLHNTINSIIIIMPTTRRSLRSSSSSSSSRVSVSLHTKNDYGNDNGNDNDNDNKSEKLSKLSSMIMSTPIIPTTIKSNNELQLQSEVQEPLDDDVNSLLLFQTWIDHSHADYHDFTEKDAIEIRSALLEWYNKNRRKLPWRGDPPPFDGSTSGINNNNKSKKKNKSKDNNKKMVDNNKNQKSITSFFDNKPKKSNSTKIKSTNVKKEEEGMVAVEQQNIIIDQEDQEEEEEEDEVDIGEAIPITAYGVWVSEIMCQQTRVEAVIPYWIKWMKSFPTVYELAAATEDEVNAHWAGLGFYRRARYLHQGAKYVVEELDGKLPTTPQGLSKIQGIGPYTAAAIASIAFDVCVPVVDGNVCRVLSRLRGIANHIKHPILKDKLGWKLAGQIVEAGDGSSPGMVNQALMELGATYCAPSGSGIDDRDPLTEYYLSTLLGRSYLAALQDDDDGKNEEELFTTTTSQKNNTSKCEFCDHDATQNIIDQFRESICSDSTQEEAAKLGHSVFPTDPPKKEKREEDLAVAVLLNRMSNIDGESNDIEDDYSVRYLMIKRPCKGLLAGQWEFPNVCTVRIKDKKKNQSSLIKIPSKADRDRSLSKLLVKDLFLDHPNDDIATTISDLSRHAKKEPLEHIFSHVRHHMWIEVGNLYVDLGSDLEWTTISGKQMRWMNKNDMKEVGITSGVKKILQAVDSSSLDSPTKCKRKKQKR